MSSAAGGAPLVRAAAHGVAAQVRQAQGHHRRRGARQRLQITDDIAEAGLGRTICGLGARQLPHGARGGAAQDPLEDGDLAARFVPRRADNDK